MPWIYPILLSVQDTPTFFFLADSSGSVNFVRKTSDASWRCVEYNSMNLYFSLSPTMQAQHIFTIEKFVSHCCFQCETNLIYEFYFADSLSHREFQSQIHFFGCENALFLKYSSKNMHFTLKIPARNEIPKALKKRRKTAEWSKLCRRHRAT